MKEIKSHITLFNGPGLSFFLILLIVLPLILAPLSNTYGQKKKAEDSMKAAGLIHMNAGRYGEAIDLFNKYISANPRKSEGYNFSLIVKGIAADLLMITLLSFNE